MDIKIGLGDVYIEKRSHSRNVRDKGKSIVMLPSDYTILDLETTGLDPNYDDVLEIGALKVRNDTVVDRLEITILPSEANFEVPSFVENLTGLTTQYVKNTGVSSDEGIEKLLRFTEDDLILGYNTSFDINFIFDLALRSTGYKFTNDYIDIMRISRKVFPDLKHHRVKDMVKVFNLEKDQVHRALSDSEQEMQIYYCLQAKIDESCGSEQFLKSFLPVHRKHAPSKKASEITSDKKIFDHTNPFFQQSVCFTGKLDALVRKNAMQLIKDLGGEPQDGVNRRTNYLILGDTSYSSSVKDGQTTKLKKAYKLKQDGQDIDVITETVFMDMIHEHLDES